MQIVLSSGCSAAISEYLQVYAEMDHSGGLTDMPTYLVTYWEVYKADRPDNNKVFTRFRDVNFSHLYLDSGVFSARKLGQRIPVDRLINCYHQNSDVVRYVFSMDEGSHEQQLENARYMHAAGVPVIPIYHASMPLDYIDRFAEFTDYIALGTIEAGWFYAGIRAKKYMNNVFSYIHRRGLWPLKIHALGCESVPTLETFPFYSSDASSFVVEASRVENSTWDNKKNRLVGMSREDCRALIPRYQDRYRYAIQQRVYMQQYLTSLWEARGVTFNG